MGLLVISYFSILDDKQDFYIFYKKIAHMRFILYIGGPGTGKTTKLKRLAE